MMPLIDEPEPMLDANTTGDDIDAALERRISSI